MLLGHVAVAALGKQTIFEQRSFVFLLISSFIPDLIDKPAQMFLALPGRGIGHSLVIFFALASTALVIFHRLKLPHSLVQAALVMWIAHLAGDFLEWHVLLWPFYKVPIESYPLFDLSEKLYQFYVARMWPEQFWLEIVCISAAIFVPLLKSLRVGVIASGE